MDERVAFREEQRFRQPWLHALLLGGVTLAAFAAVAALSSRSTAHGPGPGALALLPMLAMLGIWLLFRVSRLEVEVRGGGLFLRFYPFERRLHRIPLEGIVACAARRYRPIAEYGGWGIRGFRRNRAYNVSGNEGLQLVWADGRRLLVGSRRAADLAAAVQAILPHP